MRSCSDSDVDPLSLTIVIDLELRIGLFLAKKIGYLLNRSIRSRNLPDAVGDPPKKGKKLLIIPKLTGSVTLK